ncbi:hypothetical protein V1511DRAFT_510316 [Dipodascopsis uninucleata]
MSTITESDHISRSTSIRSSFGIKRARSRQPERGSNNISSIYRKSNYDSVKPVERAKTTVKVNNTNSKSSSRMTKLVKFMKFYKSSNSKSRPKLTESFESKKYDGSSVYSFSHDSSTLVSTSPSQRKRSTTVTPLSSPSSSPPSSSFRSSKVSDKVAPYINSIPKKPIFEEAVTQKISDDTDLNTVLEVLGKVSNEAATSDGPMFESEISSKCLSDAASIEVLSETLKTGEISNEAAKPDGPILMSEISSKHPSDVTSKTTPIETLKNSEITSNGTCKEQQKSSSIINYSRWVGIAVGATMIIITTIKQNNGFGLPAKYMNTKVKCITVATVLGILGVASRSRLRFKIFSKWLSN